MIIQKWTIPNEVNYPILDDSTQTTTDDGQGKLDKHDVKGIVYSIPCECGSLYIGETGRTLKTRLMEHKRSVCNRDTNNGIAVHVIETDHSVQWEQAAVIKTEEFITKWKVQEALTIRIT